METKKFKIAIIGGGIIGLYLSWKLSEQGHFVSVFDKKNQNQIGQKVCSALFSERLYNFIPRAKECVKNEIHGCVINFPKKKVQLNFNPIHLVINREQLVKILIELNQENNTKIFFNQELAQLPSGFDYIIGCDGAGSITRRSLNLLSPKIVLGVQTFIQKAEQSDQVFTYPTSTGFCWKIPTGDCVEYGIMGDPKNIQQEFDLFLKQHQIENHGTIFSAAIPQPKFVLKDAGLIFPKQKNITLCGDASGLTKPWSGGGIIWGLTQADLLLKTFPDFLRYKKQAIHKFQMPILQGQISKKMVYFLGNKFPFLMPSKLTYDNDFPSIFKSLFNLLFK